MENIRRMGEEVLHVPSSSLSPLRRRLAACQLIHWDDVAASVKLMYQPQPTPEVIKAFKDTSIRAFSCGYNHVVALDTDKQAWSWGTSLPIRASLINSEELFSMLWKGRADTTNPEPLCKTPKRDCPLAEE